ncbi:MAG: ABC transporter ATP-binding protein [Clostridia bacterium]|nr:ABC transporter ATP-binding protein [Clostridia bacterium]
MSKLTKLGRRYLILTCFFLVVESLAYTLCVYYTASILQHAQDGSLPEMLKSAVIAIALLAVKFVGAFAAKSANLKFLSDGTIRMRNDIMKSIFSRPFYLFRKQNDAYYLNLLGLDTDMYASERLAMVPWIFSGISDIIIYIVSLYLIHPLLMAACLVLALLPLLTSNAFTKITQRRKKAFSEASESFTEVMKEGIEGYEPLRIGHGEASYIERFLAACRKKQDAYSASSMANAISMQTLYTSAIFLNIGCTAAGGWLLLQGALPVTMLFAAVSYSSNLANAFTNITEYIITIRSTKTIAKKLHAECQAGKESKAAHIPSERSDLVYENVSFSFGDRQLYQNFSYHFRENGVYAIIGESGSGKSTLLKLLLKYYDDYSGTISLAGRDIKELSEDEIFHEVGVVDQSPFLFNASLYENIMLFSNDLAEDSDEYRRLLQDVNLTALAQRVGNTPLGDFGDNISGGERQRINIARAMRRHPRIMVFDEPTTGLDPENVNLINEFIFDHTDMLRIVIGHNRDSEYLKRFDDVINIGK